MTRNGCRKQIQTDGQGLSVADFFSGWKPFSASHALLEPASGPVFTGDARWKTRWCLLTRGSAGRCGLWAAKHSTVSLSLTWRRWSPNLISQVGNSTLRNLIPARNDWCLNVFISVCLPHTVIIFSLGVWCVHVRHPDWFFSCLSLSSPWIPKTLSHL